MNKTKIQLLIDEMQKRTANKKAAAERREKINQQIQQLQAEREKAGHAADREALRSIRHEIQDLEDDLFILDKQSQDTFISKEAGQKVWKEYEADYAKQLDSLVNAYRKQAAAAAEKFMAIVDLQNEALAAREQVASACGIMPENPMSFDNHDPLPDFKMKFFEEKEDKRFSGLSVWQPSAKWIMLAGLSKDPEEESSLFTSVLRLRKHYEPKKEDEQ